MGWDTPAFPATPSVQIEAEAVATLLSGKVAWRPPWLDAAEVACAAVLGLIVLALAARLRPLMAAVLALLACLGWTGAAVAAGPGLSWLVDPAGPAVIALASFATAAVARFARDEWRARLLQASFEQRLAPALARRIALNPAILRLRGEMREITAMITDIEGFTGHDRTRRPVELVALLDEYFEVGARIVTEHGGMVEKLVGDSIHAIFNAPFELEAHAARAARLCAALGAAAEQIRASPRGRLLQLGAAHRHRDGAGDRRRRRRQPRARLHGVWKRDQSRRPLEAANKDLGTAICIGPGPPRSSRRMACGRSAS